MTDIIERIETDPAVLHGKPHIVGTRVPVDIILGFLGDGLTPEEIIKQHYPHITREDVLACVRYARQAVQEEVYVS
jgi:uncharacterized protein (DUF433 family)